LEKNRTWHTEDSPWKAEQVAGILHDNHISFETMVEVGCGAAQILVELRKVFPHAYFSGYDISHDVQRFWHDLPSNISVSNTDFMTSDNFYDVLLVIDVIEHVRDYMGFLEALLPRARFQVFHIPLELSAQSILRDVPMRTRMTVGHLHYFSMTTALATLKDCGYQIIDWKYTNTSLDRASTKKAKVLNLLRRPLFRLAPEFITRLIGGWGLLVLTEKSNS